MHNVADEMFAAIRACEVARDSVTDAIGTALGFTWIDAPPCSDITFDEYDLSFELMDVPPGFRANKAQCIKLFEMGFHKFWFNHTDGTETCYYHSIIACPKFSRKIVESQKVIESGDVE
jgi:hypothetical protein